MKKYFLLVIVLVIVSTNIFAQLNFNTFIHTKYDDKWEPFLTGNVKSVKTYCAGNDPDISFSISDSVVKNGNTFFLKSVEYYSLDHRLITEKQYFYDGLSYKNYFYNHNLTQGSLFVSTRYKSNYRDSSLHYIARDEKQNITDDLTLDINRKSFSFYNHYVYDYKNNKVYNDFYNYDTLLYFKVEYTFDVNGNIVNLLSFDATNEFDSLRNKSFSKFEKVNQKYRIVSCDIEDYQKDGRVYKESHIVKYDALGREVFAKRLTDIQIETNYSYENQQKIVIENIYQGITQKKYDLNNNLLYIGNIDFNTHKEIKDYYIRYQYEYDQFGNWTTKYCYHKSEDNVNETLEEVYYRDISYYNQNELSIAEHPIPVKLYQDVTDQLKLLPIVAFEKKQAIIDYKKIIASGDYGQSITINKAEKIDTFTPKLWKLIEEIDGDLIGDTCKEKVLIYDTPMTSEGNDDTDRCLAIVQKQGKEWVLLFQTIGPIMPKQNSFIMRADMPNIEIKNKTLIINHYRDFSSFWNLTHIYRFQQNDWYLIGASLESENPPCGTRTVFDYNLNTGKGTYYESTYDCEKDKLKIQQDIKFKHKLSVLPLLDEIEPFNNNLKLPKLNLDVNY